jgi:indole-3-glycerol phosphate synthase
MEVKRASPSEGTLRAVSTRQRSPRAYRGAADAVSVLVDTPFFGGAYADLAAVRAEFDGPILAKDFVVDPRQVPEARAYGRGRGAGHAFGARGCRGCRGYR